LFPLQAENRRIVIAMLRYERYFLLMFGITGRNDNKRCMNGFVVNIRKTCRKFTDHPAIYFGAD
jgi:hypothetical protein